MWLSIDIWHMLLFVTADKCMDPKKKGPRQVILTITYEGPKKAHFQQSSAALVVTRPLVRTRRLSYSYHKGINYFFLYEYELGPCGYTVRCYIFLEYWIVNKICV